MNKSYQKLLKNGHCIIKNVFDANYCEKLVKKIDKLYIDKRKRKKDIDEGTIFGQQIIRDLVLRDPKTFLRLIDNKKIIKILNNLFKDSFILENIMASNSLNVKNNYKRIVHIDSHLPTQDPKLTTDAVAMICLDDFKKENGATKIWPKSHLSGIKIHHEKNKLKNNKKKHVYVEAPKGSLVIFLGQLWHQVGKNINNKRRWAILIHYKRWWIKPSTDFTKCGNKIFKLLNKKQKELFGFNSIVPKFNLKNQSRNTKTLRNIKSIGKSYTEALKY